MTDHQRRALLALLVATALVVVVAVAFAVEAQTRQSIPAPMATVETDPAPSPTYSGDELFVEVAEHQGLQVDRAASVARAMCSALDDGVDPTDVAMNVWGVSDGLGPHAAEVILEFGTRAYCPAHTVALDAAAATLEATR